MAASLRWAAFAPYWAVAYPLLGLRRARAELGLSGPWRSWVTPQLAIGGFMVPTDAGALAAEGVGAVVNVSRELVDPTRALRSLGVTYLRVPCWDGMAPSIDDARRGVRFIADAVEAGRSVYVHCANGVGRSVALVVCYRALHQDVAVDEALEAIRRIRPRAGLRKPQRAFVDAFVSGHRRPK